MLRYCKVHVGRTKNNDLMSEITVEEAMTDDSAEIRVGDFSPGKSVSSLLCAPIIGRLISISAEPQRPMDLTERSCGATTRSGGRIGFGFHIRP